MLRHPLLGTFAHVCVCVCVCVCVYLSRRVMTQRVPCTCVCVCVRVCSSRIESTVTVGALQELVRAYVQEYVAMASVLSYVRTALKSEVSVVCVVCCLLKRTLLWLVLLCGCVCVFV